MYVHRRFCLLARFLSYLSRFSDLFAGAISQPRELNGCRIYIHVQRDAEHVHYELEPRSMVRRTAQRCISNYLSERAPGLMYNFKSSYCPSIVTIEMVKGWCEGFEVFDLSLKGMRLLRRYPEHRSLAVHIGAYEEVAEKS
ncbi:hypothetical protein HDK77DRAFT_215937 [Phyllosticta capitalensis]